MIGSATVPVGAAAGQILRWISHRSLVATSVLLAACGCLALAFFSSSEAVFFGGGAFLCLGALLVDISATHLLNTLIDPQIQKSTYNAGRY